MQKLHSHWKILFYLLDKIVDCLNQCGATIVDQVN